MAESSFRGRIYDSIVDTIGATPLVRLQRLAAAHGVKADCWQMRILQPAELGQRPYRPRDDRGRREGGQAPSRQP